jgi:hypothetical protein
MQMLEAGGIPVHITPGYGVDSKHPLGKYELVNRLRQIIAHGLPEGAIKVMWAELPCQRALPLDYRLVLLRRREREPAWLPGLPNVPTLGIIYDQLYQSVELIAEFCDIPSEHLEAMRDCYKPPTQDQRVV